MHWELHRQGRWRSWLGARFGGGFELGDRVWRRCLHLAGLLVLLYYVLPVNFLLIPNWALLLLALAAVLVLETLRWRRHVELPTIRPHEVGRVASFAFFAVGLTAVVLLFPPGIAIAVVLGTAIVDPLIGEIRLRRARRWAYPAVPWLVYLGLAAPPLVWVQGLGVRSAVLASGITAAVAIAVERPRLRHLDDDLTMSLAAAVTLGLLVFVGIGHLG